MTLCDRYLKNQRLFVALKAGQPFLIEVTSTQRHVPVGLEANKIQLSKHFKSAVKGECKI